MLVCSLQSINRGSTSLLRTVEHLAARKDQRREPVEGNETPNAIQRRLLAKTPDREVAGSAAEACRQGSTRTRGGPECRRAEEDGLVLGRLWELSSDGSDFILPNQMVTGNLLAEREGFEPSVRY